MKSSFWKSGHTPTLFAAFLYFDLSFMVWYLLGPLAVQIAADLHLTTQQRGLVVATPILAGAVLRFLMGMLADKLSPKTAGLIGQVIVIVALFCAWKLGIHSYEQALLLGMFLGMAGASFAVALPLASQWYPAEHQGKAMGIAAETHDYAQVAIATNVVPPRPHEGWATERFTALRSSTTPPVGPGTAPRTRMTSWSVSALTTSRFRVVTLVPPSRPAMRTPLKTRAGVAHWPIAPGLRWTRCAPWEAGWPLKL